MDFLAVIAILCTKVDSPDVKRADCEPHFKACVEKLYEMPKNEGGLLSKFDIAYEIYEDQKIRVFACR